MAAPTPRSQLSASRTDRNDEFQVFKPLNACHSGIADQETNTLSSEAVGFPKAGRPRELPLKAERSSVCTSFRGGDGAVSPTAVGEPDSSSQFSNLAQTQAEDPCEAFLEIQVSEPHPRPPKSEYQRVRYEVPPAREDPQEVPGPLNPGIPLICKMGIIQRIKD